MSQQVQAVSRIPKVFRSLTLAALGIVFGDIGTSPLYAVREVFHGPHAIPYSTDNVLGILSLILWSLIIVISIKYLVIVMHADNKGEGGELALTALAFPSKSLIEGRWNRGVYFLGLFGAALLVGDGIITPAISVLSAIEGLEVATPFFAPYVIPLTLITLAALFFNQHHGTARIGAVFGIIVTLWFLIIAALGLYGIYGNMEILKAVNPMYGIHYFMQYGFDGMWALGAVFLVVTGGEALYADMGHFGKRPIRRAWFMVAFPCLVLNYFGQGALLLTSQDFAKNPFYLLAPSWALYPVVVIATMATVIASQAVISGVFSMTHQAIQLGLAPRFKIIHTSSQEMGQIYIPHVNWALFVAVCWLVLEFKSSSAIAAAYGIAVSTTMFITTLLACTVAARLWNWGWMRLVAVFSVLFIIDIVFVTANFSKIAYGGWFPLTMGGIVFTLMTTWRRGRQILAQRLREKSVPFSDFLAKISANPPTRVKGIAFFMTADPEGTPPALFHNVRHNRVLHERNIIMTVVTKAVPFIAKESRIRVEPIGDNFFRVIAYYGFIEAPDIHEILAACSEKGLNIALEEITFFLGRETLLATGRPGMAVWREKLFSFMSRNSERATAYFNIPPHQVVEMGLQIEL